MSSWLCSLVWFIAFSIYLSLVYVQIRLPGLLPVKTFSNPTQYPLRSNSSAPRRITEFFFSYIGHSCVPWFRVSFSSSSLVNFHPHLATSAIFSTTYLSSFAFSLPCQFPCCPSPAHRSRFSRSHPILSCAITSLLNLIDCLLNRSLIPFRN